MLHELSAAPSPLGCIVCVPWEISPGKFLFLGNLLQREKKVFSSPKKSPDEPHPVSLHHCCLMVDLSKPLVVFTEGLMVSAKPAKPWREWSLGVNEEQLVSPCLWQLECLSAFVSVCDSSSWPLLRVRSVVRGPNVALKSPNVSAVLLLLLLLDANYWQWVF